MFRVSLCLENCLLVVIGNGDGEKGIKNVVQHHFWANKSEQSFFL